MDRFTIGAEKIFLDGLASVELRVPIEYRLTSDLFSRAYDIVPGNGDEFFDFGEGDGTIDPETFQLFGDRDGELANISAIFKAVIMEGPNFLFTAGVGVTAPTAQDVNYGLDFQNILITYDALPGLEVLAASYLLDVNVSNETTYISPFLAWLWLPTDRLFHQGFLQVEVAANLSTVLMRDFGSIGLAAFEEDFALVELALNLPDGAEVDLHAQTLMRLNLGLGYLLVDNPRNRWLRQLAALFEIHYTTLLQDGNLSQIPLALFLTDIFGNVTAIDAFDPVLGNLNNRMDIVNVAAGLSATVGKTVVTHGVVVPVRGQDNRGFDFEYNLQVQRPF